MEKNFKYISIFISIFLFCILNDPVFAQNGTSSKDIDKDWEFEIAAYGFAFGVTGDVGFNQANAEVDVDFGDILDHLDFGFLGFGQARKGPWSFILDGTYMKLSADKSSTRRNLLTASVDAEIEQAVVAGIVGYRFFEGEGNSTFLKPSLDFLVGARYNNVSGELGIQASLLGLTLTAQRKQTEEWVDPVIGLRGTAFLNDQTRVIVWGDFGGFGVGSDFTWQTFGGLGYTFSNGVDVFGGYRAYAFDYEDGTGASRVALDLLYHGPMLGVGYKF
jgi:hypothetical protein